MHDDHGGVDHADLDVPGSTAALDEPRMRTVGDREQLVFVLEHGRCRGLSIEAVAGGDQLDLRDHPRRVVVGGKTASGPNHLCGVAGRRHDRGFFDAHRHQEVPAVDPEVGRNRQRQLQRADDVLDHVVGAMHVEGAHVEIGEPRHVEPGGFSHGLATGLDVELEESGQTRVGRNAVFGSDPALRNLEVREQGHLVLAVKPLAKPIQVGTRGGEHHHEVASACTAGLGGQAVRLGLGDDALDGIRHDRRPGHLGQRSQALVVSPGGLSDPREALGRVWAVAKCGEELVDRAAEDAHRIGVGPRVFHGCSFHLRDERTGDRGRPCIDKADMGPLGHRDRAGLSVLESEQASQHRGRDIRPRARAALRFGVGGQSQRERVFANLRVERVETRRGEVVADDRGRDCSAAAQA